MIMNCLYTEKRRLELLPEDLCRQFTQTLQEMLLPDLHRHLEDFRSPQVELGCFPDGFLGDSL